MFNKVKKITTKLFKSSGFLLLLDTLFLSELMVIASFGKIWGILAVIVVYWWKFLYIMKKNNEQLDSQNKLINKLLNINTEIFEENKKIKEKNKNVNYTGVFVSLAYTEQLLGSKEEKREQLIKHFQEAQKILTKFGGSINFDTVSSIGQMTEAIVNYTEMQNIIKELSVIKIKLELIESKINKSLILN